MNNNKYLINFLCVLLIVVFTTGISTAAVSGNPEEKAAGFVVEIYDLYASQQFAGVYETVHPEIKEILTEEKYCNFQKDNFDRYKLKIKDVEIGEIKEIEDIPAEFSGIVSLSDGERCFSIRVNYGAEFNTVGGRQKREIEKNVYLTFNREKEFYLLWNPEVIPGEDD